MAVLKKFRSRWLSSQSSDVEFDSEKKEKTPTPSWGTSYDIRPLTISQLDECWRLDQRCFVDGEAYSRETFDYLLTAPESVSFRAVTAGGVMAGFVIGLVEPDHTGHVTTVGVGPEHRRRNLAKRLMWQVEDAFRKRNVRLVRLEVRTMNTAAQKLYESLGYTITQKLPKYYSNGGDGLLMLKSLE
jgi:ribosomal-protein-alanine acetyltransferase